MSRSPVPALLVVLPWVAVVACSSGSDDVSPASVTTSGSSGSAAGHSASGGEGQTAGSAGQKAATASGGNAAAGSAGKTAAGAAGVGPGGAPSAGVGGAAGGSAGAAGASTATTMKIALRTLSTSQYVASADAGTTAKGASAGAPETFTLTDLDGGALEDGDEIALTAPNGRFVGALDGGGGPIASSATSAGPNEAFLLRRVAGAGAVAPGDAVAIETKSKHAYWSAIDGGGREVLANAPWIKEWETFNISIDGVGAPPSTSSARQKVLDYFAGISGKRTVAGQHNKEGKPPAASTDEVAAITGKAPALWSADFGFGQGSLDARPAIIAEAKKQWDKGAIVQLMYHTCAITRDELCGWDDLGGAHPQHLSDVEWSELVTDGTPLHAAWLARLDKLSVFFADLRAAGVAPLFRPLHEMNQGVFWWGGRGGAGGTRRLFQITHDYLVKTKGFDQIVWVWDVQDFSTLDGDAVAYHPGADVFDIAALDMYEAGYTKKNYDIMLKAAAGKPIAIGECATLPTAAELQAQPAWTFFMLWPDFIGDQKVALPPLYGAGNVVTLGQMPGWK